MPTFMSHLKDIALLLKSSKMSGQFESFPGVHMGHVSVYYNGNMIVLSGFKGYKENSSTDYWPSEEIWIYDQLVERWVKKVCTYSTSLEDIPQERTGATGTVIDNYLYLFGGYSEEGNLNTFHRLDLNTFKWRKLQPRGQQPLACDKSVSWQYEGKFYLFGGYGRAPNPSDWHPSIHIGFIFDNVSPWHYLRGWNNQFVCYDPATNSWTWLQRHGTTPTPRAAHAVARLGTQVYLLGGRNGNMRLNDMYVLDMASLEWKLISANDPQAKLQRRSWHTLTPINDHLMFLFGGFSQDEKPLDDCWIYDAKTGVWSEMNYSFTKPRFWHSAILSNCGEIYIFGGFIEKFSPKTCESYQRLDHCAKDMLSIALKPRSLLRHSLAALSSNKKQTEAHWKHLPAHLQDILTKRCRYSSSHDV